MFHDMFAVPPLPNALFEPGWWDRMADDTNRSVFSPEAAILTVLFFGVFIAVIVVVYFVNIDFRKKDLTPPSWITNTREILKIFNTALRQRSKMRVSFQREDRGAPSTDGSLVEFSPKGLILELTSIKSLNVHWIDKVVECDFRLRPEADSERQVFYNFTVKILDISKTPEDFVRIRTAPPSHLEQEQKRATLRIEPPQSLIRECSLWRRETVRAHGRADDPETWGDPFLDLETAEPDEITVADISGGGMRLDLKADIVKKTQAAFDSGGGFYLALSLVNPDTGGPLRFLLNAKLQNVYSSKETPGLRSFGLLFAGYGESAPEPPHLVVWKAAGAGGVRDLDDWVFSRHLDLYRSKGIE